MLVGLHNSEGSWSSGEVATDHGSRDDKGDVDDADDADEVAKEKHKGAHVVTVCIKKSVYRRFTAEQPVFAPCWVECA